MESKISPYEILNVKPNCTIDELKAQFKKLACTYHPDKGGNKHLFNIIVSSFKEVHKDIRAKQDDKQFYELKDSFKEDNNIGSVGESFRVEKDGFHEKFNKFFDENKTIDPNFEKGYNKFINDDEVKTSKKHYKIQKYKEPEGNVSSKLPFQELGVDIKDFSGKNDDIKRLQYMDYQYAHTTSKLIEPTMLEKRQDFKDIEDIKKQRANANFELTDSDKRYYERLNVYKNKKEQKRISNLFTYDAYLEKHSQNVDTKFLK